MSIEDRLRQRLAERAAEVPLRAPDWNSLRRRGAARRRWRTVSATLTVVVAAAAVAASQLGGVTHKTSVVTVNRVPVPAGFTPVSVTWISASEGWVLGHAQMAHTTDDGQTWEGAPAPPVDLQGTRFADGRDGWAFGPDVWATHDGGRTWRDVFKGNVTTLEAAAGSAFAVVDDHVFAAGVAGDDWKPVGPDPVAAGALLARHGAAGYVAAADGTVIEVSPNGLTRRGAPCGSTPPAGLAAVTTVDVAALCVADAGAGSSTKALVISHDSAATWQAAGSPPRAGQPTGLAAATSTSYVVGAASGATFLYRTADGGATWTAVLDDTADGGAPISDLGFTDADHGVAILGRSQLLRSLDGGATWVTVHF